MTDTTNISTLAQFKNLKNDFRDCSQLVIDTETNGLKVYAGHRPISLSIYFPEIDRAYNLAWAHGYGEINVPDDIHNDNFHKKNWQGKSKKQYYKRYWWNEYVDSVDPTHFGNVPQLWLADFLELWNDLVHDKLVIYFNSSFDIHMMSAIGFNKPTKIEDVRFAVGLAFEDWLYPKLIHPVTMKTITGANNGLKWQANLWGVEGALDGEEDLKKNTLDVAGSLAEYILENWDDPINSTFHTLKRTPRFDEVHKRVELDPKSEMWMLPSWAVAPYAMNDVIITWGLRKKLMRVLENWHQVDLYKLYCDIQIEVIIRMEENGALLDIEVAREQQIELEKEMDAIRENVEKRLKEELPDEWTNKIYVAKSNTWKEVTVRRKGFNVNSSQQVQSFFRKLDLNVKGSDKKVLEKIVEEFDKTSIAGYVARQILDFRKATRASNTYLKKWIASVDKDGYIHPHFNLIGPVTGRTSSSSGELGEMGNIQNIPSRKFTIKKAIVTPPGWVMGQIDFGQIELRLGAWIAGCTPMIDRFNAGLDMHEFTMEQMNVRYLLFGNAPAEAIVQDAGLSVKEGSTPEEAVYTYCRTLAKTCNFALLYRGSYRVLVRMLDIPQDQATILHSAWNRLYPEYEEANNKFERLALTYRSRPDGKRSAMYVSQPIGGRTRKYELYPTWEYIKINKDEGFHQKTRQRKARDAFNHVVQGQAAYIMLSAALSVCKAFGNDIIRPFAIIHDSLNFYIREDKLDLLPAIAELMTAGWETNPRQIVDVELSTTGSWQDLAKYDLEGDEDEDE